MAEKFPDFDEYQLAKYNKSSPKGKKKNGAKTTNAGKKNGTKVSRLF